MPRNPILCEAYSGDPYNDDSLAPIGITAAALMERVFEPIKFVIPGYVVEGLTVFAGAPKLGKSWAVLEWCVAVASGGRAFGSIPCEQGDVLYLALEDSHRRLQSRLHRMRLAGPERLTLATCDEYIEWLKGNQEVLFDKLRVDFVIKSRQEQIAELFEDFSDRFHGGYLRMCSPMASLPINRTSSADYLAATQQALRRLCAQDVPQQPDPLGE